MIAFKEGLYVALVTPYDVKGRVNANTLVRLMARNIGEGAAGFLVGGSSGECFLLRHEERVALFTAAAAYKDRTRLIAHVGALSTEEACVFAREAVHLGYQRIAATAPFYYKYPPAAICQYFARIAEAADMPVIVYNFPGNTGVDFDLRNPDYRVLFTDGTVCGVKHTNQIVFQMERFMALNPALEIYNGFDETMVCGFAYGASASIGSTFNCMLPPYERLRQAFFAGDPETARTLQHRCNDAMEAMCRAGLFPSIKYVLARQGFDCGLAREPFLPLSEEGCNIVENTCSWLWSEDDGNNLNSVKVCSVV